VVVVTDGCECGESQVSRRGIEGASSSHIRSQPLALLFGRVTPILPAAAAAAAADTGVDLDYEPTNSNCQVRSTGVTCATDAESVAVTAALRSALPQGRYLLSTASWHVGCYGEGAFKTSQPASVYTGE
jgi:hypothetical protein